jgi:class 3 adenylate cyclase
MIRFKTLQRKLLVFLLLPVGLLLLGVGFLGFLYARQNLLQEWREAAVLRLQRAAHHLDMRLSQPLTWMESFAQVSPGPHRLDTQTWILEHLRKLPGVKGVNLVWQDWQSEEVSPTGLTRSLPAQSNLVITLSSPRFLYEKGQEAVTIEANLLDNDGHTLGRLQAAVSFQYLMQDVLSFGWTQSYMACLVDNKGRYLAHTDPQMKGMTRLGESQDKLELAVLKDMQSKPSGTILGPGHPPRQVIGFYHLKNAPWAILLYAQGEQILSPIVRFRVIFFAAGAACVVLILLLIRLGVSPVVTSIHQLSQRATQVAQGVYGEPFTTTRQDEIGQLIQSFNVMTSGLQERDFIRNTFGRYIDPEIARKLLKRPQALLLGGDKRAVAILFADLRNFTPIAETLSPEATIHLLNRFFSHMVDIIQAHEGIIEDFSGDAILAFFDPLEESLPQVLQQAYHCALQMQAAMTEVNAEVGSLGLPTLAMGVGLHVGEVVVGNIGSETRTKYGIVGSAVIVTHRIQAEARGGEVVMSEIACHQLHDKPRCTRIFEAKLKGVQEPLNLCVVEATTRS